MLRLSTRERQVAELVAAGYLNKEIATLLGLADGTIKRYMQLIFLKNGLKNRTMLGVELEKEKQR